MNTCPNCGKVAGLHSSILQGCMCQYSMQAPPQRTWVGLTESERRLINFQWQDGNGTAPEIIDLVEAKLKEKNT